MLRRFVCVLGRVSLVFGRNRSVMRGLFVVASFAKVRCLLMVTCRVMVVRRCLTMML